jgi:hypothetical protein
MDDLALYITDTHKYRYAEQGETEKLFDEFLEACSVTRLLKSENEKINVDCDEDVILDIIERVRMRKLYFYVYHDIPLPNDLNELKETALYTFWILKLHPFRWRDGYHVLKKDPWSNYALNARVALSLFIKGLTLYAKGKTLYAAQTAQKVSYVVSVSRCSSDIVQTLYYSFRYRDWSKEALMDLAESMIIKK